MTARVAAETHSAPSLIRLMEMDAIGETVLTPEQAAPWETLKVSRATWYRSAKAGEFDSFIRRVGRSYRILLSPYIRWLSGGLSGGDEGDA